MKQLEERIKGRLECYESSLPDGDLAEFKALLDASATAGQKRRTAYIAWLAPVAVAAGLALFFVLGGDSRPDVIQVIDSGSLVAYVVETLPAEVSEPSGQNDVVAAQTKTAGVRKTNRSDDAAVSEDSERKESHSGVSEQSLSEQVGNIHQTGRTEQKEEEKQKDESLLMKSSEEHSPFVPSGSRNRKPVSVKVGQVTAVVLGGTGALALASVLPSLLKNEDKNNSCAGDATVNPGGALPAPEPPIDERTNSDTHYMPIRAGLSLRIHFSDRWSLTTGLDYSWYASKLEYSLSGIHKQSVHYLGIPLRADFTIARKRWMDVYVGAGGSVDFCLAAYNAGKKISKDGIGFSLIGASGIQFNINKHLGMFLEPTFSWSIPSERRVLETYRTEFPFRFSVSTGLRLTLPTRNN